MIMKEEKQWESKHDDVDTLFEKVLSQQRERLKNLDDLRQRIIGRFDYEARRLYAKKDFVARILSRRESLKKQKVSILRKMIQNGIVMDLKYLVSAPIIYSIIIPTLFLHIILEIYHQVCFRLYSIPLVSPREYFIFDRRHLPYLNAFEKINCFYCSYFNAFIAYAMEIGARTERYWCPIKHSKVTKARHAHYGRFFEYDDGEELRKKWAALRKFKK